MLNTFVKRRKGLEAPENSQFFCLSLLPLLSDIVPNHILSISIRVADIAACLPNTHSSLLLSSQIPYIIGASMFLAKRDISQLPLETDMVIWLSNQWNVSKSIMFRTSVSWEMLLLSFFQMLGIWNLMTGASAAILHNEAPKNKSHVLGMMKQKDRRNVGAWWLYRCTNSKLPVSGLVLHRTIFYHFGVTPILDFPLHATKLNPNYHKREDWN